MLCYMLSVSICSRKVVTGSQGCGRVWRLLTLGWLNFKCTARLPWTRMQQRAVGQLRRVSPKQEAQVQVIQRNPKITPFCSLRPKLHSGFLCIKNGWPPGLSRLLCSAHPVSAPPELRFRDFIREAFVFLVFAHCLDGSKLDIQPKLSKWRTMTPLADQS